MKKLLLKIRLFLLRLRRKTVFFIQGNDVLPHPLNKVEEEQALENLESGSKEAQDLLIEHNLRLIVYIVKRYETNSIFMGDLISIGPIGLIKAINTFKCDKNIETCNLCILLY